VLAVLAHLGAGAAGIGIRPSRTARRVDVAAVAISPDAAEPIIEDVPPPPSPPPPPPQASLPARSASAPASPPVATAPSSLSSLLPALAAPGFAGFSDSGPRLGAVGGGTGPTASAVDATRPQATAAPAAVLVAARPLRRPAPRFPSAARREGRTGVVVVQLRVDEQGVVVDVRIVQSDPPGVFDAAAVESVRGWTFAPATSDGEPVPSWVRQTIRFTLEGT
jgi:protein TonB